jgi:hypothetical protein
MGNIVAAPARWRKASTLEAVPRFLTLCMACTPCTARTSHATWDVPGRSWSEGGSGCGAVDSRFIVHAFFWKETLLIEDEEQYEARDHDQRREHHHDQ